MRTMFEFCTLIVISTKYIVYPTRFKIFKKNLFEVCFQDWYIALTVVQNYTLPPLKV